MWVRSLLSGHAMAGAGGHAGAEETPGSSLEAVGSMPPQRSGRLFILPAGSARGWTLRSQRIVCHSLCSSGSPAAGLRKRLRTLPRPGAQECRACFCNNGWPRRLWHHAAAGEPRRRGQQQRGSGDCAAAGRLGRPPSCGQGTMTRSTASWRHQVGTGGGAAARAVPLLPATAAAFTTWPSIPCDCYPAGAGN